MPSVRKILHGTLHIHSWASTSYSPSVCVSQNYVYILVHAIELAHTDAQALLPLPPRLLYPICSQARTDPNFKIGRSSLGMQVFCNAVTHVPNPAPGDMADAQQAAAELPTHVCSVNSQDGYRPEATLFVDEDWLALRASRESKMGQMLFRPCVRFCSTHYQYVKDDQGLRIVQVGIGATDRTATHFVQPPGAEAALPGANNAPTRPVPLC